MEGGAEILNMRNGLTIWDGVLVEAPVILRGASCRGSSWAPYEGVRPNHWMRVERYPTPACVRTPGEQHEDFQVRGDVHRKKQAGQWC